MYMIVHITTKDLSKFSSYTSNFDCPLATALKRMFPDAAIQVGGYTADVDRKNYSIPTGQNYEAFISIKGAIIEVDDLEQRIANAKAGKRNQGFKIELTEI